MLADKIGEMQNNFVTVDYGNWKTRIKLKFTQKKHLLFNFVFFINLDSLSVNRIDEQICQWKSL